MSKTNQTGTKAADTSKAGKAASPQDTAGKAAQTAGATSKAGKAAKGYVIAEGHAFHTRTGRREAGSAITPADLKSAKDPTGEREFQRQIEKGTLVVGKGRTADDLAGDDRAGGGVIDNGGATGAAPSAAQITAAATGDDPAAAQVVDAALAGTEKELEQANGVEGDAGKADGKAEG